MRIRIDFDASSLALLKNYQRYVQAIIYKGLSEYPEMEELHNSNILKKFNFSLIQGKYIPANDFNIYTDEAKIFISSSSDILMTCLRDYYEKNPILAFGNYKAPIKKITELKFEVKGNKAHLDFMSPVTIHETTIDKKTKYYNPNDSKFFELVNNNFSHKHNLFENVINFSDVNVKQKYLFKYKGFIIEAYRFTCDIECDNKYLKYIFDEGLGARNSCGFGMAFISNSEGK